MPFKECKKIKWHYCNIRMYFAIAPETPEDAFPLNYEKKNVMQRNVISISRYVFSFYLLA